MKNKLSPVYVLAAGILWGTMGFFVRRFNGFGVTSMSIVLLRAVFTAIILLPLMAVISRDKIRIKLRDVPIFAGMGLMSIVFFNFCYFSAISVMPLSAAAILLYTSPVFVMLMSAVFFKEKITAMKLLSILMTIGGLALVTGVAEDVKGISLKGLLLGIGSAFGYALYSIFSRAAINRGYGAIACTGWSFAFAAIFSLPLADSKAIIGMVISEPLMLLFTLVFALTVSVIPYLLYTLGLKGMENGKAAVIASVEPVAATVTGMVIYKEIPTLLAAVGIILVISAMAMAAYEPSRKQD